MFVKRVACIEKVRDATKEGKALMEQEQSAGEEAHQTPMQEVDNLSARNKELQDELEVAYWEVKRLRRSDPWAFVSPLWVVISQGT